MFKFWLLLMIRESKLLVAVTILLLALQPVLGWLSFTFNKRLFDSFMSDLIWKDIGMVAATLAVVKMGELVIGELSRLVGGRLSLKITYQLEHYLYNSINPNTITASETPSFTNDVNIIRNSLFNIEHMMNSVIQIAQHLVMLAIYGYLIVQHSWLAFALIVLFSVPSLAHEIIQSIRMEHYYEIVSQHQVQSRLSGQLLVEPQAIKESLIYRNKSFLLVKWMDAAKAVIRGTNQMRDKEAFWKTISILFQPLGFFAVQLILIRSISAGTITLGDYAAITAAVAVIQGSMLMFAFGGRIFKQLPLITKRIELFHATYNERPEQLRAMSDRPIATISLQNFYFSYPATPDFTVLKAIHISVKQGDTIAIVGQNGSGKSTLAKMIFALHDVGPGTFFMDQQDMSSTAREPFFRQVAVVNQDYMKYPFSIYENIAMETATAEVKSKVDQLIRRYPMLVPDEYRDHLETVLGNQLLGARQLSGGQWQRIAIARALYREKPFLLLDEATSEVDPVSEMALMRQILNERGKLTTLIVTHNLALATMCKQVVVMNEGVITESGSHEGLLQAKGRYYEMWREQRLEMEESYHEQKVVS
ncbi:ATP-binding cassette domain-containing protein [Paenibacillus sp. GCM10027627]|uniref:ATP-binding cassette domain-containing protein n=1 Tax=unclassified Paenibacillus TaxID=185978 RepID=UPI0036388AC9